MKNTTSENVGKLDTDTLILPKAKTRRFPIIVSETVSYPGGAGLNFEGEMKLPFVH